MDTMRAFTMGVINRGNPLMVFDWVKAATLIKEQNAQDVSAGLAGDWGYTGGPIMAEGKPITGRDDTYTYLASTWATPEIEIDGVKQDCFVMQEERPYWDAETLWPKEALKIIGYKVIELKTKGN